MRLTFYQGSVTVLWKMVNHQENFPDKKLPHELFLTTRQTTKKWICIATNGSEDLKLSKTQFSKMIQWVGLLRDMLGSFGNICKKVIADLPIPLC